MKRSQLACGAGVEKNGASAALNPEFLLGGTWNFPNEPVEHIETHAAHVFLCGDRAFKIKKAVKLPYLDFSTIEQRRDVLARELAINKAYAPDIYLHVTEKLGEPVLVMHRFPTNALLSWHVKHHGIDDALAAKLAATMVRAYEISEQANVPGSSIMAGLIQQLADAFTKSPDIFSAGLVKAFIQLQRQMLDQLALLLDRRGKEGQVRRCHGDAHCGNIALIDGKPVLFDAIEFSDKIATVDVLYDLSFLIMDLLRHDQCRAANIILNRYVHLQRDKEDLSGLSTLPLFLSTRAGVRALVTADLIHELPTTESGPQRGFASRYFDDALEFLKPNVARLVCVGGLSGTGKSTLAMNLAPSFGAAPGAIHVRSDIERKVLAGVIETERLKPEHYSPSNSILVYDAIFARARKVLETGHSVVLDAVFASEYERRGAENIARLLGVEFQGIWLETHPDVMKARVAKRVGDASDADPEVIDVQLGYQLGDIHWGHINASGDQVSVCDRAKKALQIN
jgi:aminoglycoside phosphotransferase family enzyme/predicted kinase